MRPTVRCRRSPAVRQVEPTHSPGPPDVRQLTARPPEKFALHVLYGMGLAVFQRIV